jgi:hypothetical protein
VDTCRAPSFGRFVRFVCQGRLTAPSWQSFALLAGGWAWAPRPHPSTTSLWLTGAAPLQPCSRFDVCRGCPFDPARWRVWACRMRHAAQFTPAEAPLVIACDDTTQNKAGGHSAGGACERNGAGSARQAYRTRRGVTLVLGIMRVPLPLGPGHAVTVPRGLARSLTAAPGRLPHRPYRSRRALARAIVDGVAAQRPGRQLRGLGDGGLAPQACGRDLPATVEVVSRVLRSGTREARPEPPVGQRRGRPPRQGERLGSPHTWARQRRGGQPPPTAAKAAGHAGVGLGPTVLPGRLVRGVGVRRPAARPQQPGQRTPPPPGAACCPTALARSVEASRQPDRDRGAVAMTIRARHTCDGLGQDQGRKLQRLVGAQTFRRVRAAARTRWCLAPAHQRPAMDRRRARPCYRQPCAPRPLDRAWACREALLEAGVCPLPRFTPGLAANHEEQHHALSSAA